MMAENSFWRDSNRIPIIGHGLVVTKELTFTGDDATVTTSVFTITGVVEVLKLWGICTTTFGANHTDAHLRINDQTATDQVLMKTTTLDLSAISEGACVTKFGLAAAVGKYITADAAKYMEPTTLQTSMWTPFIITQKTGSIQTDIEYLYTTTDDPTTGAMKFYIGYLPLSDGAHIEAA